MVNSRNGEPTTFCPPLKQSANSRDTHPNGPVLTSQEEATVRDWNSALPGPVRIGLHLTRDERSRQLSAFCKAFTRLAPRVSVLRQEGDSMEPPGIHIGRELCYHAIPLGTELEPFLAVVSSTDKGFSLPASLARRLGRMEQPASLSLYISPHCPFCPVMARQLFSVARANNIVRLTIVDVSLFPEMARAAKVRSVPTALLDEQFRWTGSFSLEELIEAMIHRDSANPGAPLLENMLKQGDAGRVAQMMIDNQKIFPAFLTLLTHEKWPVRLGAMVAIEEIARQDPKLANQVVDVLWEEFDDLQDPVKGDMLYVVGEAGDSRVVSRLEMVLRGAYDGEVKEAAREALQKIRK